MLLFAALDASSALRFVGEVPRGAACGCFCPTCRCPLVAKQGDEVQWHFAHEGNNNERPECAVGAANLLRRLAIESVFLASQGQFNFRPYRAVVEPPPGSQLPARVVEWTMEPVGVVSWAADAPAGSPIATLALPGGGRAELRVAVDAPPASPAISADAAVGQAWFVAPSPPVECLRHRSDVLAFLAREGRFVWQYLPDSHGLVTKAKQELLAHADEARLAAGRRWAAIRSRGLAGAAAEVEDLNTIAPVAARPPRVESVATWAPGQKPGCVYHFRRLKDGTAWVAYEASSGGMLLVPYPEPFDGWDEYFPARMAAPDLPGLAALRVLDLSALLMFFRDKTSISRVTSAAAEFASL